MEGYRKELKYIVNEGVLLDVRNRISGIMRPDEHQTGDRYRVRSLYFDNYDRQCYMENLAGVSPREKYRIRTYDCQSDPIIAEIKIRHRDTISKMSAPISRYVYDAFLSDDPKAVTDAAARFSKECDDDLSKRVLEKFTAKYVTKLYRPACIVDYERSAYVYDIGNVRITADRNIFSSAEFERMFDENLTGRPALDDNMHVLEIKYDELLPGEISGVLGGLSLIRCNNSKYVQSVQKLFS